MKVLLLLFVLLLGACTSPQVVAEPPPPQTQAPTPPTQPTPPDEPTQPQPAPQPVREYGNLEVCVDGLGVRPGPYPYKLMSYAVFVAGTVLYATATNPCPRLDRQPAGAVWEVVAHDAAWGLKATPNQQTVTIVANRIVTARVRVGWE